jgi:hypothetical protein
VLDVRHDLADELRECGAVAGAQEGEGVFLDKSGPICGGSVEGVEKSFVDSDGLDR